MAAHAAPLVLSGTSWHGNGGLWSAIPVNVGTPPQQFDVLPCLSAQFILLPHPDGCDPQYPRSCGGFRGVSQARGPSNGFESNNSTTWQDDNFYKLNIAGNLTMPNNAYFGLDMASISAQNKTIVIDHAVVGATPSQDFNLGFIGLDPALNNFTDSQHAQPSFVQSLKADAYVPSLSVAYTAGASYHPSSPPAQLVLGGYDDTRWATGSENRLGKPFGSEDGRWLSVWLQSVLATDSFTGPQSFLSSAIFSLIDTSLPYIWLPEDACERFEASFNLTYDPSTDYYILEDNVHKALKELDPFFIFKIGGEINGTTVNIEFPYAAFDLQIGWPVYDPPQYYFPIKKAHNASQYTIGRSFMQEAYVVADYERRTFQVGQVLFNAGTAPDIKRIEPYTSPTANTSLATPSPSPTAHTEDPPAQQPARDLSKISKQIIVAISVGTALFVSFSVAVLFWIKRSKRRRLANMGQTVIATNEIDGQTYADAELVAAMFTHEMQGERSIRELHSMDRGIELNGSTAPSVKELAEVNYCYAGEEEVRPADDSRLDSHRSDDS